MGRFDKAVNLFVDSKAGVGTEINVELQGNFDEALREYHAAYDIMEKSTDRLSATTTK